MTDYDDDDGIQTFDVEEDVEAQEREPFRLRFLPIDPEGEVRTEVFNVWKHPSASSTTALSEAFPRDKRGRRHPDLAGIMQFLAAAMPDDEFARLEALIDSPEWKIGLDKVGDVFAWVVELHADRPTKRSRRSSRTRPSDGRTERGAVIELEPNTAATSSS